MLFIHAERYGERRARGVQAGHIEASPWAWTIGVSHSTARMDIAAHSIMRVYRGTEVVPSEAFIRI